MNPILLLYVFINIFFSTFVQTKTQFVCKCVNENLWIKPVTKRIFQNLNFFEFEAEP